MSERKFHLIDPLSSNLEMSHEEREQVLRAEDSLQRSVGERVEKVALYTNLPDASIRPYVDVASVDQFGFSPDEARLCAEVLRATQAEVILDSGLERAHMRALQNVATTEHDLDLALGTYFPRIDYIQLRDDMSSLRACLLTARHMRGSKDLRPASRTIFVEQLLFALEREGVQAQELFMLLTDEERRAWRTELGRHEELRQKLSEPLRHVIREAASQALDEVSGDLGMVERIRAVRQQRAADANFEMLQRSRAAAASIHTLLPRYPDIRVLYDSLIGMEEGSPSV